MEGLTDIAAEKKPVSPNAPTEQEVTYVKHWTDRLFSFRITRPASFRFRSGEFIMVGLRQENGKPLLRAYSITSSIWDEELEFYSIKVQDGPLTSRLQHIQPGDTVILGKKPTGTLVLDALLPTKRLYMFSTGTGIAPFGSLIRDPETYERYDDVILIQTCRTADELAYGEDLAANLKDDPLVGEFAAEKFRFFTTATQDPDYPRTGRITEWMENGRLYEALGVPPLNPETDRVMICGSMAMLQSIKALAEKAGLTEGSNSAPAEYVIEKAFVG
ncbi:MAG: ferredoxin--NADP reductase [Alphaproteobacteria bacterium]